jgi:short-subunit dehydrogenase
MNSSTATHILITGASRGIGAALAINWSYKLGNKVRLSLIATSTDNLEQTRLSCTNNGSQTDVYALDITHYEKNIALIENISKHQPIDIAVLNSGVSGSAANQMEPLSQIRHIIDTNLTASLASATIIAEQMQQRGSGKIVLINSISAFRGLALTPSYCASKAGLKAYGDALRCKLAPHNVNVISVYPGFINTDMSQQFNGPKPFLKPASKMAAVIIHAVEKNQAVVVYPKLLGLALQCLNLLPTRLGDKLLRWLGYN